MFDSLDFGELISLQISVTHASWKLRTCNYQVFTQKKPMALLYSFRRLWAIKCRFDSFFIESICLLLKHNFKLTFSLASQHQKVTIYLIFIDMPLITIFSHWFELIILVYYRVVWDAVWGSILPLLCNQALKKENDSCCETHDQQECKLGDLNLGQLCFCAKAASYQFHPWKFVSFQFFTCWARIY